MTHWFPAIAPERVLLDLGVIRVYWYSILVLAGILAGFAFARRRTRQQGITEAVFVDVVFYSMIAGLVGARFWHVFVFQWAYYREHLVEIPQIWQGGIAIQGALVFGLVTLVILCHRKKISPWLMTDLLAPGVALGQAIGRWGNFFNQELYGKPTTMPWGIFVSEDQRVAGYESFSYFHPVFFYESILNLLLFVVLYSQLKRKRPIGSVTIFYFVGYGVIRFFMDFVRIDPMPMFVGLRYSQWISLIFIIVSAIAYFLFRSHKARILPKES